MADRVGQQLGNYRLLRLLGRGSFAEVYLGEHLFLERLAAIKILHVQMDDEAQALFRSEAQIIARLEHPHIVSVLEFGIQEQTPYLVMQYTPGGTIRAKYPAGTRIPLEQIVIYVKQIASALDYAHQQRVIHRDIKPDNLLLNADDKVVLSDFGIAVIQKTLSSPATETFAGTPLYTAPEQFEDKPCGASDQYALGITVYEWLTGAAPFQGGLRAIMYQHLNNPPPSFQKRLSNLPLGIEEIVFKALAKDPEQRFANVDDFASALEEIATETQPLTLPKTPTRQKTPARQIPGQLVVTANTIEPPDASETTQPMLIAISQAERLRLAPQANVRQAQLSPTQRNRWRFLRRVRTIWIDGVLRHSLHGAAIIALGLQEQPDALLSPMQVILQHTDSIAAPFPPGTRITEVYDRENGELLILGAPGSGKTTLLLELARDLLEQAEHDEQYLMPVLFPLSSWATEQQSLDEWMIEELINIYQVPSKVACSWVDNEQIIPLLDGLDEVAPEKRLHCIETIKAYQQEHSHPLVVCCRSADYMEQTTRINLSSAITIQALQPQQVDDYLAQGGEALWALRLALHQDRTLYELTSTPLMLSILTLTYHNMPVEAFLRGGAAPTRQQVFEYYIERMLSMQRGSQERYQPEQTRRWLTWLAKQLTRHGQTVFYLEKMQVDWLLQRWLRGLYYGLTFVPVGALIGLFLSLLIGGIAIFHIGLLSYGPMGLIIGLLLSGGMAKAQSLPPISWSWSSLGKTKYLRSGLLIGLFLGLLVGVINDMPIVKDIGLLATADDIVGAGMVGALTGVFSSLLIHTRTAEIQPTDVIAWSWGSVLKISHLWRGLIVGLILGFVNFLIYLQTSKPLLALLGGLIYAVLGTLFSSLLIGLFDGLSSETLEEHGRVKPNEGMRRSIRNSMMVGVLIGPLFGLISGLCLGLFTGWTNGWGDAPLLGLFYGLVFGLSAGFLTSLLFGGEAWIRHVTLHLLLWCTRSIPWKYSRFLDYASERILLRKVGSGYTFPHRLLLDYFASLDK